MMRHRIQKLLLLQQLFQAIVNMYETLGVNIETSFMQIDFKIAVKCAFEVVYSDIETIVSSISPKVL